MPNIRLYIARIEIFKSPLVTEKITSIIHSDFEGVSGVYH